MGLTKEERIKAKQFAANGAQFMFIPSSNLCAMIAQGHILTQGLNKFLMQNLLEKKAIWIESEMLIKYCNNKLDKKNTFLFDNGDIKVIQNLNRGQELWEQKTKK